MKIYFIFFLALLAQVHLQSAESTGIDAFEFLEGFLDGLNERGDINQLIKCLRDIDIIAEKIAHALELIMFGDVQEKLEGLKRLIEGVQEYINTLKPCSQGFDQLKKLFNNLQKIDLMKILRKIMQNLDMYGELITRFVEAFRKQEYKLAGKYLGQFLLKLFLTYLPLSGFSGSISVNNNKQCADTLVAAIKFFSLLKGDDGAEEKLKASGEKVDALCDAILKGTQSLSKENEVMTRVDKRALVQNFNSAPRKFNKGSHMELKKSPKEIVNTFE